MATISNLFVDQGSDFSTVITLQNDDLTPMNLTGASVYSQFRKSYESSTAYSFTGTVSNAVGGQITLSLSGTTSTNIPAGRYLYDVELILNSTKIRVAEGIVTITPEITRIP